MGLKPSFAAKRRQGKSRIIDQMKGGGGTEVLPPARLEGKIMSNDKDLVREDVHHVCCNFRNQPIGSAGCICVVTYRQRMQELEAAERKLAEHVEAERELLHLIEWPGVSADWQKLGVIRDAAERLHKLREGIPQPQPTFTVNSWSNSPTTTEPQRLSREQLIEKAREAVIEADYDVTICNIDWRKIFKLMADFALSLDVNLREELRIANANLRGAWAKCAELAHGKATVEVGFEKTTGTEASVTKISLEGVTPSGDGQKEDK